MPAVAKRLALVGAVTPYHLPKDGFYAAGLPADLPARYRWRSRWEEFKLRARLAAKGFGRGLQGSGVFGVGRLYVSVIRSSGGVEHLGLVSTRVVTDAFVAAVVDDWDGGSSPIIDAFNYHGTGTGTNAENVTDTALQTESTTALNPDSTRPTGTKSQPAANQMRSVGVVTYDANTAVTEHGLFSQAATGGGILCDRSVFSAINVVPTDSIQFTYTLTLSAGG